MVAIHRSYRPESLADRVSAHVQRAIAKGAFAPGERLPSLRRIAAEQQVSVTTAIEAFRRLEDRGVIEARPQSGHFVRLRALEPSPEPACSKSSTKACVPELGRSVLDLIHEMGRPELVPLGAAVPSPKLLPIARLARTLARAVKRDPGLAQAYDPLPGYPRLRREIAKRMLEAGCEVSPDDLIITAGAQEAIELALRATTQPGDVVAVESPTYHGLLEAIQALHLRALEIATHPRDGIDVEALEAAIRTRGVKAVALVPTNGNPLGHNMPLENRQRVVRLLAEAKVPLIEDDTYGELCFAPRRPPALYALDRSGGTLFCGSFSKTLAPGFRVGWIVGGRFRQAIEWLKFASSVASATPSQLAIAEYLASGGYARDLRKMRRGYADLVARMARAVGDHFPAGTCISRPTGGHVLWVEMPVGVDAFVLHEKALAAGISLAPGPIFSASGRYRNCIRINCAVPWSERIEQAVRTLGSLAKGELGERSPAPESQRRARVPAERRSGRG